MNVGFTFARNAERGAINDSDTFLINCSHTTRSSTSTSLIKNKQTKTHQHRRRLRRHHQQQQQKTSFQDTKSASTKIFYTSKSHPDRFLSSQTEVINE